MVAPIHCRSLCFQYPIAVRPFGPPSPPFPARSPRVAETGLSVPDETALAMLWSVLRSAWPIWPPSSSSSCWPAARTGRVRHLRLGEGTRILASAGLPDAVIREQELDETLADTAFWATIGLSALAGAAAFAAPPLCAARGPGGGDGRRPLAGGPPTLLGARHDPRRPPRVRLPPEEPRAAVHAASLARAAPPSPRPRPAGASERWWCSRPFPRR